jgi:hypothetical protein
MDARHQRSFSINLANRHLRKDKYILRTEQKNQAKCEDKAMNESSTHVPFMICLAPVESYRGMVCRFPKLAPYNDGQKSLYQCP